MRWQGQRFFFAFSAAFFLIGLVMVAVAENSFPTRKTNAPLPLFLASAPGAAQIPVLSATVLRSFPHDPHAFTQGLEYYGGYLYESTGIVGKSMLRKVELSSGKVIQQVSLPAPYFGEGLTIFRGKIYQLTWLSETGFIYDLNSFRQVGKFQYQGEGWGLTHDNASLILSDGTNKLRYLDPHSFNVTRTLEVYAGNEAVTNLNELEHIDNEVFANVWHSPRIARIDARSGQLIAWIDLSALVAKEQPEEEGVLNGIAYDQDRKRMFVTGKLWSHIIEIKLE
jgi:glutaminyl-peptide cyclotransferase